MPFFPNGPLPAQNLESTLNRFNTEHETTTSFVGAGVTTVENKRAFIQRLLEALNKDIADEGYDENPLVTKILTCLRFLSREPEGCDDLFGNNGVAVLLKQARLDVDAKFDFTENPSATEALKCLCNTLLQHPPARLGVAELGGVESICHLLKDCHSELPSDFQFLLMRITFLLSVEDPAIVRCMLAPNLGFVDTLTIYLQPLTKQQSVKAEMVMSEILKTVYNLMSVGKPAPATTRSSTKLNGRTGSRSSISSTVVTLAGVTVDVDYIDGFKNLLPVITHLLINHPLPSTPLTPPISHMVHTLLNFPLTPYRDLFFKQGDVHPLVGRLCEILAGSLDANSSEDSKPNARRKSLSQTKVEDILPSLLLVLGGIARQDVDAKDALRDILLHEDIDRSKPLDEGTSLTSRLIGFMTSIIHPNIRDSVCELIFVLCDEDPGKLVRYTGYGHAAGFLYSKGIAGGPFDDSAANSRPASRSQPIHPISGKYERPDTGPELEDMTEEEKEREAERLMVLFERLNRTGVIKAVFPK
ncbi:guanine nucleotide exchange factor [Fimicolochytrium jonesii]|uniref:guanine nucleotide exchange factor n=1 Tax=Fimicolochytrium jonesii TaxID=1396493 RepID=UPI0022FE5283|nr:guanine nucleotide exchange factor [Fimicolochytrium jonesii]KAI8823515.1 guanine nucleotide exchange factor [Fimicolochytrium jonesii]